MDYLIQKLLMIPAILAAFTFRGYAQGYVADRLGDKSARFQGRLNLNPMNHIDPLGLICMLFLGFGFGKPAQNNPSAYKNYYKDDLKVKLAGPLTNFLVAFIGLVLYVLYVKFVPIRSAFANDMATMLRYIFQLNVGFGVFNLIPIPGFDGFAVLRDLAPGKFRAYEDFCYRYQMIIFIAIIMVGGVVLSPLIRLVMNLMLNVVGIFL